LSASQSYASRYLPRAMRHIAARPHGTRAPTGKVPFEPCCRPPLLGEPPFVAGKDGGARAQYHLLPSCLRLVRAGTTRPR
jgi:hypothetical protein